MTRIAVYIMACAVAVSASAHTTPDTTALAAQALAAQAQAHTLPSFPSFDDLVEALALDEDPDDDATASTLAGDIRIDEPRLAYVNITGIAQTPTSKHTTSEARIDFYDGDGNHISRPILIKGQGGYSLRFPKRNISIQFCDEAYNEDNAPNLYIGSWVRQNGFHLKAFYTDFLRGIGEVGYKWFTRVVEDRAPYWERCGYYNTSQALCVPDGFPCIVYLNGEFEGIYAWQLKKHRRNMNMKKDNPLHVHLDGNLSNVNLFNGTIKWNQFEVRNPKTLVNAKAQAYNQNSPTELMDESTSGYNADNPAHHRSAQVKAAVIALSQANNRLEHLTNQGKDAVRAEMERCFDIPSLLDYQVFFRMQMNGDGTTKNWQWFTYDGQHWMVTPYDLDQTMGLTLYGYPRPATLNTSTVDTGPFPYLSKYYFREERARWIELRKNGIFAEECIIPLIDNWYTRVGEDWYDAEKKRWPESPCYCPVECSQGWELCLDWDLYDTTPDYRDSRIYQIGDICKYQGRLWRATAASRGTTPVIRNSDTDSIERLHQWVTDRLAKVDKYYAYHHEPSAITPPTNNPETHTPSQIYDIAGRPIPSLQHGLNIIRHSDGTRRVVLKK